MGTFANSRMSGNMRASGAMDCRYSQFVCSICGVVSQKEHKRKGKLCKSRVTAHSSGPSYRSKKHGGSIGGYGGSITNER